MSTALPPLPDHPERKAFEEWIERELNYGYNLTRDAEGNYPHDATDTAWLAWQGRAALAEAAVKQLREDALDEALRMAWKNETAAGAARAIESLKGKTP